MHKITTVICFLVVSFFGNAQSEYKIEGKKQYQKIKFEIYNNVIVIPVEVNGISLKFLLDTGVAKPIVFNFLKEADSLKLKYAEKVYLRGLGEGDLVEALKSTNNIFKIGNAVNRQQEFYAIFDPSINFAPKLGVQIDGIIGFDVFKDFIVEINYSSKRIKLYNPEKYEYKNCKKCQELNLEFYRNKPYLRAKAIIKEKTIPLKMLIDTGSSESVWLFENNKEGINQPNYYFNDLLGQGLAGDIRGKRSKIQALLLNNFKIKNPNVAYPDSTIVADLKIFKDRNGNIGGNILKRFNCIFDYRNAKVTLKKNSNFNKPFNYNKSGIDVEHDGIRLVMERDFSKNGGYIVNRENRTLDVKAIYSTQSVLSAKPAYRIYDVRKGSPADEAGVFPGDFIISINKNDTKNMNLQQVVSQFFDDEGKRITLLVKRGEFEREFIFYLKSPINKKAEN